MKSLIQIYFVIIVLGALGDDFSEQESSQSVGSKNISVDWGGEALDLSYKGHLAIEEKPLGEIENYPDGLTFHPDGRIVVCSGRGTSREMSIAYWLPNGELDSVFDMKFSKEKIEHYYAKYADRFPELNNAYIREKLEDKLRSYERKLEKKGFFWFFSGMAAFDSTGACYFTLGSCSPNGVYKVVSSDPVEIKKLYSTDAASSLQIPAFDKENIYLTCVNSIKKYSLKPQSSNSEGTPWLTVHDKEFLICNTLIVNSSRMILEIIDSKIPEKSKKKDRCRVLLVDKDLLGYWVLDGDNLGPMAMSSNGEKMITFNKKMKTINEFTLKKVL